MSEVTKRALEVSLKNLLLQKPIDKITINDITGDCGISRMTFYYHFQDIYDLVEWSCREDASRVLAGHKTYNTWQEGFLDIFNELKRDKPFIMNVYNSVSREQVENYLYSVTFDLIMGVVEEKAAGLKTGGADEAGRMDEAGKVDESSKMHELGRQLSIREDDKRFIANIYKYVFVGIVLDWIRGGMKAEPEEIIRRLDLAIHGNIERALIASCQQM